MQVAVLAALGFSIAQKPDEGEAPPQRRRVLSDAEIEDAIREEGQRRVAAEIERRRAAGEEPMTDEDVRAIAHQVCDELLGSGDHSGDANEMVPGGDHG